MYLVILLPLLKSIFVHSAQHAGQSSHFGVLICDDSSQPKKAKLSVLQVNLRVLWYFSNLCSYYGNNLYQTLETEGGTEHPRRRETRPSSSLLNIANTCDNLDKYTLFLVVASGDFTSSVF